MSRKVSRGDSRCGGLASESLGEHRWPFLTHRSSAEVSFEPDHEIFRVVRRNRCRRQYDQVFNRRKQRSFSRSQHSRSRVFRGRAARWKGEQASEEDRQPPTAESGPPRSAHRQRAPRMRHRRVGCISSVSCRRSEMNLSRKTSDSTIRMALPPFASETLDEVIR